MPLGSLALVKLAVRGLRLAGSSSRKRSRKSSHASDRRCGRVRVPFREHGKALSTGKRPAGIAFHPPCIVSPAIPGTKQIRANGKKKCSPESLKRDWAATETGNPVSQQSPGPFKVPPHTLLGHSCVGGKNARCRRKWRFPKLAL